MDRKQALLKYEKAIALLHQAYAQRDYAELNESSARVQEATQANVKEAQKVRMQLRAKLLELL